VKELYIYYFVQIN